VLKSIQKELGLENIEQLFFGAAPLNKPTRDFFAKLNMPVAGVYGLSETSGSATFQEFPQAKLNTVGYPLPGTQIRIYNPNEHGIGEVCFRGRNVMMGYLKNDKATWDVFDGEGFFHTGDMGHLDSDNYLELTGRMKEILITSGGENVPPQPIETLLKDVCPIISHAIVIGDERKYLSVLLTLKCTYNQRNGQLTNELQQEVQSYIYRRLRPKREVRFVKDA
jgi:long-chain-fatty-acid--CoA ligase ACSBG